MPDLSSDGEEIDAPPAPDYEEAPEQVLDEKLATPEDWKRWPLWAKMRLLRRLRTEIPDPRPEQFIDMALEWYIWTMWGGRGSGKSDEANRWGAEEACRLDRIRVALVARTFSDVRDTIYEGETGLLAYIPDWALRGGSRERAYNRSLGELFLANGSRFKGFSSEKPNQLRGPQHHRAILDEASSWDDADEPLVQTARGKAPAVDTTMSNLMLGLRNKAPDGSGVRMVSSTTPKPNELTEFIHDLGERRGHVRVLSTYANFKNLDDEYKEVIVGLYEGTDVAAQELEGQILSAAKGAAWTDAMTAAARAASLPAGARLEKTVVGVDPAVSSKDGSDETGLVAVRRWVDEVEEPVEGKPGETRTVTDRWLEVAEDRSGTLDVGAFPGAVLGFVESVEADELLVEINNGYDFVVSAITTHLTATGGTSVRRVRTDRVSVKSRTRVVVEYICETADGHSFVLKPVWQSVDKLTRAKAASIWWQRGRAVHPEGLQVLEKQMTRYDGTQKKSPDRLDGLTTAAAGVAVARTARSSSAGGSPIAAARGAAGAGHPLLAAAAADPDSPASIYSQRVS